VALPFFGEDEEDVEDEEEEEEDEEEEQRVLLGEAARRAGREVGDSKWAERGQLTVFCGLGGGCFWEGEFLDEDGAGALSDGGIYEGGFGGSFLKEA
jgi:hypothetical protein